MLSVIFNSIKEFVLSKMKLVYLYVRIISIKLPKRCCYEKICSKDNLKLAYDWLYQENKEQKLKFSGIYQQNISDKSVKSYLRYWRGWVIVCFLLILNVQVLWATCNDTTSNSYVSRGDIKVSCNSDFQPSKMVKFHFYNGTYQYVNVLFCTDNTNPNSCVQSSGRITFRSGNTYVFKNTLDNSFFAVDFNNYAFSDTYDYTFPSTNNSGTTLVAGERVDVSNMIAIPSISNTLSTKINIFDFKLIDGAGDNLPTDVRQIVFHVAGTSTDAIRSKVTWILNGTVVGSYNSDNDTITFSSLSISVLDGQNITCTLSAYFNDPTDLIDNATFSLSINGSSDITVNDSKTKMATGQSSITNNGNAKVDITATKLIFDTQPSPTDLQTDVTLDFTIDPIIKAVDVNNQVDTDFSEAITLTENGSGSGIFTNNSVVATDGVATFTGLTIKHNTAETFQLVANDEDNIGTDLPTVNSVDLTSSSSNSAPVITSNGGGITATINVNENTTTVTTVTSTDDGNNVTYTITGGADQAKFSINSTTGALTFITAPDFENPSDDGADNTSIL